MKAHNEFSLTVDRPHEERNRLRGRGEHLHERAPADGLLVAGVAGGDADLRPESLVGHFIFKGTSMYSFGYILARHSTFKGKF